MRPRSPRRRGPSALARAGAVLGFLVYLLPLAAAMPRAGPGGVIDRGPGIIVARHRQALLDVVSDDRPTARPHVPALPPARVPTLLAPEPGGCHGAEGAGSDLVARPPAAGTPRSPPVS